jgi:hypothetical protein
MTTASKEHGEAIRAQLGSRSSASGLLCPRCLGGATKERSVSAWHRGLTITAKCWRNACPFRGTWDATTGMGLGYTPPASGDGRTGYRVDTLPLDQGMEAYLEGRYRLTGATLRHWGLRQYPGSRGVYLRCTGFSGGFRGWVLRWVDGTKPKTRSYPAPEATRQPWQAWFPSRPGLVVCVEDVFSAMRLWQQGTTAVAMLGVSLSDMKAAELSRHATQVVVALDSDATARAIEAARRYNFGYRRLLGDDIKDMTEEQLTQWITSLTSSVPASPAAPRTQ